MLGHTTNNPDDSDNSTLAASNGENTNCKESLEYTSGHNADEQIIMTSLAPLQVRLGNSLQNTTKATIIAASGEQNKNCNNSDNPNTEKEEMMTRIELEKILANNARHFCISEGIEYSKLPLNSRLLVVRYLCNACGPLPLYYLDLTHLNKVRCSKCHSLVSLKNVGKYGKIRKKVAISLRTCLAKRKNAAK